jgi:hypothetical protein
MGGKLGARFATIAPDRVREEETKWRRQWYQKHKLDVIYDSSLYMVPCRPRLSRGKRYPKGDDPQMVDKAWAEFGLKSPCAGLGFPDVGGSARAGDRRT